MKKSIRYYSNRNIRANRFSAVRGRGRTVLQIIDFPLTKGTEIAITGWKWAIIENFDICIFHNWKSKIEIQ